MAPEVYLQQPYDSKVDVFSFAVVACEILSRSRAYGDCMLALDDIPKAVAGVKQLRPTIPKRFPPSLVSYLTNMWAADPKLRPTFVQVVEQTEALYKVVKEPSLADEPSVLEKALSPQPVLGCCVIS